MLHHYPEFSIFCIETTGGDVVAFLDYTLSFEPLLAIKTKIVTRERLLDRLFSTISGEELTSFLQQAKKSVGSYHVSFRPSTRLGVSEIELTSYPEDIAAVYSMSEAGNNKCDEVMEYLFRAYQIISRRLTRDLILPTLNLIFLIFQRDETLLLKK